MSEPILVGTERGLIPVHELSVVDTAWIEENARIIKTQWFLGADCVRQDIVVSPHRGLTSEATGTL